MMLKKLLCLIIYMIVIQVTRAHQQGSSVNRGVEEDDRIPFWNMAHMVNSFKEIHDALQNGANAIEVDISFDAKGYPTEVYHGLPCDCGRHCTYKEDFISYLKYLSRLTDPSYNYTGDLTLIMFDLKLSKLDQKGKESAGVHLAKLLDEHIYGTGSRYVNIILAVNHVDDKHLIGSFLNYIKRYRMQKLQRHVGFDVSMNDPIENILDMWSSLNNMTVNIWQGDGITNCGSFIRNLNRFRTAGSIRDKGKFIKKVYFWTIDLHTHIRKILRYGIDAFITNHPERVYEVLQEPEFSNKYRLANILDDPFQRLRWRYFNDLDKDLPNIEDAVSAVSDARETAEKYIKEFPSSLAATADLLIAKSIQKIVGQDRSPTNNN